MAEISQIKLPNDDVYDIVDNKSGYITGMTILSYGISTWNDFLTAYQANKVVYCRASSATNPASGSQTRLAFMAYVNNATSPTEVEFQYYRSVSSHTDSQQGDQVYVYKLTSGNAWTVTVREAYTKINVSGGISKTYTSGTNASVSLSHSNSVTAKGTQALYPITYDAQGHITGSGTAVTIPTIPTNVSSFTNDAGYLTSSDIASVLKYKGTKATVNALPSTGNATGDVWHITADGSEYAWDGSTWQELGTAIDLSDYITEDDLPTTAASATTGVSIADHSTSSIYGVNSTTTSVTGVQSTTTTASKVTLGTAFSIPNVTSAGTASNWVFEDVTVPIRADSATTVPTAAASATTVPIKNANATSIPNVTAVGSGSFTQGSFSGGSLAMAMDSTDTYKLKVTFTAATHGADSHTHIAPTLGTAISIYGVQSSTTSVTGVSSSTSVYGVKSGTNSTITASHVKSGGNGTAPTLGTAISVPNVTGTTDVTVPIKATSATTVPVKATNATTVVTSKTHSITDSGHTHNLA